MLPVPGQAMPRAGTNRPRTVVVVGGGITGLSAAYALRQEAGARVTVVVLEAGADVGGKLRLHEVGGLTLDAGAEAMLARRPEAVDLARAVGLGTDLVAPATTQAGIWSRGRLRAFPRAHVMGVPADLHALATTGLLTPLELMRIPVDTWLPRTPIGGDVAVGAYVRARMGDPIVDRLVEPLLGGVYAGRADRLSLAATVPALFDAARRERSLLAAARQVLTPPLARAPATSRTRGPTSRPREPSSEALTPTPLPVDSAFAGIRGGVARLATALAAASGAEVRRRTTVRELRRTTHAWDVIVGAAPAPERLAADAVILAVPARPAARLLVPLSAGAAAEVGQIEYASVALVTFVVPATNLPAGSGFLVPPVEGRAVKGVTFSSAKWGWVGDAAGVGDLSVLRVSLGRHGDERILQRDDADLAELALADLVGLLKADLRPVDASVTRWGGALPQYAVGHPARVARVRTALTEHPTLRVAGAAFDGVGIPACIASGRRAADDVLAALGLARSAGQQARGGE